MDRKTLIRKLDDGVSVLRGMLAENDGSTLKAISASAKAGFKSLKTAFERNEKAQKAMGKIKKEFYELENAVKKGDRKLSAKLLAVVEKNMKKYRKKYDAEPAAETPGKAKTRKPGVAKAAAKTKPASSGAAKKSVAAPKPAAVKRAGSARKPATAPKTVTAATPATARKAATPPKPAAGEKPGAAKKSTVAQKADAAKKPATAKNVNAHCKLTHHVHPKLTHLRGCVQRRKVGVLGGGKRGVA